MGRGAPVEDAARSLVPLLAEHAARVDREASFPLVPVQALRESGLFGLLVPNEYGGLGGDLGDLAEVAQILAEGCLSTAMIWAMHCQQSDVIARFGTERLCKDVLPRVAAGEVYLASVTTEPRTGSTLLHAHAPLVDGGTKRVVRLERDAPIVTGGEHAEAFLVTMRDGPDAGTHEVSMVYAAREQLDIQTRGGWNPLGMRGTHSVGLHLAGEVPEHQIVGGRGGFRRAAVESLIPTAHVGWSACWLGAARAAMAGVVGLVRSPRRPRSLDPGSELFAAGLARARVDIELVGAYLNQVVREVCAHRAEGRSLDTPVVHIHLNTLKVAAAELTHRSVDRLVQLTGFATGYLKDSPVPLERHLRDLRSAALNYANDRLLAAIGAHALLDRAVYLAGAAHPAANRSEGS
jgi:acyl-CoA dehydrogenase